MAQIEENRFCLELSLKTKTNVVAQLKDIKVEVPDTNETDFTWLFFLMRNNSLETGVKYDRDYWPNNSVGAEWSRFPRDGSHHKQVR